MVKDSKGEWCILKLQGKLSLKSSNDDYILFSGGRNINLSEKLNEYLLSDVTIIVKDLYYNEVLFCETGKFIKEKISKYNYWYHVNGVDLDEALWDNTGRRLEIEIKVLV